MPTYTPDTPQASQPMNVTQSLILNNFQAITDIVAVNHVGFNVDNFGTHNILALQQQSAPTTTATEIDLFCQVTGSPNPAELYIVYPQGAATTTPVLFSVPYDDTATGTANSGYVSFPSGVKIGYGTIIGNPSSGTVYASIPSFSQGALLLTLLLLQLIVDGLMLWVLQFKVLVVTGVFMQQNSLTVQQLIIF